MHQPSSQLSLYLASTSVELPSLNTPHVNNNSSTSQYRHENLNTNTLDIQFGGMRGFCNHQQIKAIVDVFASSYSTYAWAQLRLRWEHNRWQDINGRQGFLILLRLFDALSSTPDQSPTPFRGMTSLQTLASIDMGVSNEVSSIIQCRTIDLSHASSLKVLSWTGQHQILFQLFRGLAFHQLTDLSLIRCVMSGPDARSILSRCSNLISFHIDHITHLETACVFPHTSHLPAPIIIKNLRKFEITSTARLLPFLAQFSLPKIQTLQLFLQSVDRSGHVPVSWGHIAFYDAEQIKLPRYLTLLGRSKHEESEM